MTTWYVVRSYSDTDHDDCDEQALSVSADCFHKTLEEAKRAAYDDACDSAYFDDPDYDGMVPVPLDWEMTREAVEWEASLNDGDVWFTRYRITLINLSWRKS